MFSLKHATSHIAHRFDSEIDDRVEQDKDNQVTDHLNQVFQFLTHDCDETFDGFSNFIKHHICI